MPYGYALQVLGLIAVIGFVAVSAVAIGSRRFDRETKAADERSARS